MQQSCCKHLFIHLLKRKAPRARGFFLLRFYKGSLTLFFDDLKAAQALIFDNFFEIPADTLIVIFQEMLVVVEMLAGHTF